MVRVFFVRSKGCSSIGPTDPIATPAEGLKKGRFQNRTIFVRLSYNTDGTIVYN